MYNNEKDRLFTLFQQSSGEYQSGMVNWEHLGIFAIEQWFTWVWKIKGNVGKCQRAGAENWLEVKGEPEQKPTSTFVPSRYGSLCEVSRKSLCKHRAEALPPESSNMKTLWERHSPTWSWASLH